jgi:hypothetical protein
LADLFSITAPLLIRYVNGVRHVMVERFRHPEGLVYFRPFWDRLPDTEGVQFVRGDITGEGPWKIGTAVVTLLGCHGTDPQEAAEFSDWQCHLEQLGAAYPSRPALEELARSKGYLP